MKDLTLQDRPSSSRMPYVWWVYWLIDDWLLCLFCVFFFSSSHYFMDRGSPHANQLATNPNPHHFFIFSSIFIHHYQPLGNPNNLRARARGSQPRATERRGVARKDVTRLFFFFRLAAQLPFPLCLQGRGARVGAPVAVRCPWLHFLISKCSVLWEKN